MKANIRDTLSQMLVRREYATLEAISKLVSKGFDIDEVKESVAYFVDQGWISDARYIEAKVVSLQSKGYGPIYVSLLLKQVGLDVDMSQYAWAEALSVARRKAGKREGIKLKQYLYRRGFSYEQQSDKSD